MSEISQIKLPNNTTYDLKDSVARGVKMYYGTCATAAATAAKEITVSADQDFTLTVGALVMVKFSYSNSATSVTLNVNNTGAKSIWYSGSVYTSTSTTVCGYKNAHYIYMYDGTNWVWVAHGSDSNSTYSAMSVAEGQTATATNARSMRSDYLKEIIQYHAVPAGQGVPAGGTAGQILSKVDGTDYNTGWIDAPSGGDLPEWEDVLYTDTVTAPTEDACWRITGGRIPSTSLKEIIPFLHSHGRNDTLNAHGVIYFIRKYYAESSYIDRVIFVPVDTTLATMCAYKDSTEGKWHCDDKVGLWTMTTTYTAPSEDTWMTLNSTTTLTANYDDNCIHWALYILMDNGYCNLKVKYTISEATNPYSEPRAYSLVSDICPEKYTTGTVSNLKFYLRTVPIVLISMASTTTFHSLTLNINIDTGSSWKSPSPKLIGQFKVS